MENHPQDCACDPCLDEGAACDQDYYESCQELPFWCGLRLTDTTGSDPAAVMDPGGVPF